MITALGVLMIVLMVSLGAAKAWYEGHLGAMLKGLIWGIGTGAWLSVASYLILRGAA